VPFRDFRDSRAIKVRFHFGSFGSRLTRARSRAAPSPGSASCSRSWNATHLGKPFRPERFSSRPPANSARPAALEPEAGRLAHAVPTWNRVTLLRPCGISGSTRRPPRVSPPLWRVFRCRWFLVGRGGRVGAGRVVRCVPGQLVPLRESFDVRPSQPHNRPSGCAVVAAGAAREMEGRQDAAVDPLADGLR
jgi:hypothetical protein